MQHSRIIHLPFWCLILILFFTVGEEGFPSPINVPVKEDIGAGFDKNLYFPGIIVSIARYFGC